MKKRFRFTFAATCLMLVLLLSIGCIDKSAYADSGDTDVAMDAINSEFEEDELETEIVTIPNYPGRPLVIIRDFSASTLEGNLAVLDWSIGEGTCNGFDGFIIFSSKNGVFEEIARLPKEAKSYVDDELSDKYYTYYWIFAYLTDENGIEHFSDNIGYVYAIGGCVPAKNVKTTSKKGAVNLTWDADPVADGYLIYGYHGSPTNGATYGRIGLTTATSYTDVKASADDWNFYWVYPYKVGDDGKVTANLKSRYVYSKAK